MEEATDIILLTCNRLAFLKKCIKAMEDRLQGQYRLIIINNNSKDGTTEYLNELEKTAGYEILNIFNEDPPLLSKCYTQGLEHVKSEYFFATQDDIIIPLVYPDVMTQLKKLLDDHPRYAAITLRKPWFKAADGAFTPGVTRTRTAGAGFRVHRRDVWKDVGFGNRRWESMALRAQAISMDMIVGIATDLWMYDLGWSGDRGYPKWYIDEMKEKDNWGFIKKPPYNWRPHNKWPEVDPWTHIPLFPGKNALGVKEVPKSCGSIFRIQSKADVEKMGGFGKGQYERPWWYENVTKVLGKKVGIIPKQTNVCVSEWKNVYGNRGYPEGFNDYFTYEEHKEKAKAEARATVGKIDL